MSRKKIIVIGAGAAGLMAAVAASDAGADVTVIEKNEKAGKKIYITGKGRCNFTNACDTADFFGHVVRNPKFLYSAVYDFDQQQMMAFLENNGCPVKVERGNRAFPVSDHASDVTRALTDHLRRNHVRILLHTEVASILTEKVQKEQQQEGKGQRLPERRATGVRLKSGENLAADAVILATGGVSYPSTGSTGDGYRFAEKLGLEVKPPAPALVPFTVAEDWPLTLQGLSLKNVSIRLEDRQNQSLSEQEGAAGKGGQTKPAHKMNSRKQKPVYEGFGEMMFTHFGVTGPLILSASSYCDFTACPQGYVLHLNLKPALTREQLEERIRREFQLSSHKALVHAIRPLFPERLAEVVARLFAEEECCRRPVSGQNSDTVPVDLRMNEKGLPRREHGPGTIPRQRFGIVSDSQDSDGHREKQLTADEFVQRRAYTFNEAEIRRLAALIQDVTMTVTGTRGFAEAIITRGGIAVKEINPSTMESRRVRELYVAGEVLDVNAQTGGYNLQIAWSTGHLAGVSAAEE